MFNKSLIKSQKRHRFNFIELCLNRPLLKKMVADCLYPPPPVVGCPLGIGYFFEREVVPQE